MSDKWTTTREKEQQAFLNACDVSYRKGYRDAMRIIASEYLTREDVAALRLEVNDARDAERQRERWGALDPDALASLADRISAILGRAEGGAPICPKCNRLVYEHGWEAGKAVCP